MEAMFAPTSVIVSPSKRRLSFTEDNFTTIFQATLNSPHSMDSSSTNQTMLPGQLSRAASPAISTTSSLTSLSTNATPPPPIINLDGTTEQPPAKRRKLTSAEKQVKAFEKAEREKERTEAKAKKDEEKALKNEVRRVKNEAKEEKKREKELKAQEKEEEKRKKQAELDKKAKQQPRLFSFFKKPDTPVASAQSTPIRAQSSPAPESDYRRAFLPFFVPTNTTCAPVSRFTWDEAAKAHLESTIDRSLHSDAVESNVSLKDTLSLPPSAFHRGISRPSVKEVVARIVDGDDNARPSTATDAMKLLRSIPLKTIYFSVDVRPPYLGTYTKISGADGMRLARQPFKRGRIDTDYDYDSEAEWEEPEEGEDILSDADSDAESTSETDDMEGFLDDDGIERPKRRFLLGDQEPLSSGLCWEDVDGLQDSPISLRDYKLSLLLDSVTLPINPFSDVYWVKEETKASESMKTTEIDIDASTPRPPLQSVFSTNGFIAPIKPATLAKPSPGTPQTPKTPAKLLTGDDLERLKQEVEGQTVNKAALLGLLKKSFPKVTNNVLKATLDTVAARVGPSEAEKVWKLVV